MDYREFLENEKEFRFGQLLTEQAHPLTADLSEDVAGETLRGIEQLQSVDGDLLAKAEEVFASPAWSALVEDLLTVLQAGGRVYFTGCGSTGRLSIILEALWRKKLMAMAGVAGHSSILDRAQGQVVSVMAGGDFALIKGVENFEDYETFGIRQISEMGLGGGDMVVAITEGGETSFVIGTATAGAQVGAKTWFVYNNPDDVLYFQRSRKVLSDGRIRKLNLTTGPMAITGSTRMQATSMEMLAVGAALERAFGAMFADELAGRETPPLDYVTQFAELMDHLRSPQMRAQLVEWVDLEAGIYANGGQVTYYADRAALDILSDTTERSPTFEIPPFRQIGNSAGDPPWASLVTPAEPNALAWPRLLGRNVRPVEWPAETYAELLGDRYIPGWAPDIGQEAILRFELGCEGLRHRSMTENDALIVLGYEDEALTAPASAAGRKLSLAFPCRMGPLGLLSHLSTKLILNTVSTAAMAKLGRVRGNFMVYVVPTNKKLIDRASRYIAKLSGASYETACQALFAVMERLAEPLRAGKSVPPPVLEAVRHLSEKSAADS